MSRLLCHKLVIEWKTTLMVAISCETASTDISFMAQELFLSIQPLREKEQHVLELADQYSNNMAKEIEGLKAQLAEKDDEISML